MKTVVFDFDGVIHSYTSGWKGACIITDPVVPGIKEAIKEIRMAGYEVVIVSARCFQEGGIEAIQNYLETNGIEVDGIAAEKPPATAYIDDRAICFDGNTITLLGKIVNFEPWNRRATTSGNEIDDIEEYSKKLVQWARSKCTPEGEPIAWCSSIVERLADFIEKITQELSDREYEILGIMHFVDKWLDESELNQDTVNRSATAREKVLQIVEKAERERGAAVKDLINCLHYSKPKNNNVCNFCKKNMPEYPEKCEGWDDACMCSPVWRGLSLGGEEDA